MAADPVSFPQARPSRDEAGAPLLSVRDLVVEVLSGSKWIRAVDSVSFEIRRGETFALVGESGCGKSLTALSIPRLLDPSVARHPRGEIVMLGIDLLHLPESQLSAYRGRRIGMVFQEPAASIHPARTVGAQLMETIRLHRPEARLEEAAVRALSEVGIPDPQERLRTYPHQLSGGMQQRVMLALALAGEPELLIADEPTTALDVTVQAQILLLLQRLQRERGISLLLISHNLAVVGQMAHRVGVMYAGELVETGSPEDVLGHPRHPYTRALSDSAPELGRPPAGKDLPVLEGNVPRPGQWSGGCRFADRCGSVVDSCRTHHPEWYGVDHSIRCPVMGER